MQYNRQAWLLNFSSSAVMEMMHRLGFGVWIQVTESTPFGKA